MTLKAGVVASHQGKILLIRERNNRTNRYGWNIIKGTFDARQDSSISATAIREAYEEAGVRIILRQLIGIYYLRDRGQDLLLFAFSATLRTTRPRVAKKSLQRTYRSGEDITEVRFFKRSELKQLQSKDFIGRRGYLVIQDYLAGHGYPLHLVHTLPKK